MSKGSQRRPAAYVPRCGTVKHLWLPGHTMCVCGQRGLRGMTQDELRQFGEDIVAGRIYVPVPDKSSVDNPA